MVEVLIDKIDDDLKGKVVYFVAGQGAVRKVDFKVTRVFHITVIELLQTFKVSRFQVDISKDA